MKRLVKSIVGIIFLNVIWIVLNGYVCLSFEPIISSIFTDPKQDGYRGVFITFNLFCFVAMLGFFSEEEKDKQKSV